jgi:acetyltransferase EpsM
MANRLVIWGAGGHAKVVADVVRQQGGWEIVGFIDDANPERRHEPFCASTILGGRERLEDLHREGVRHALLAFGHCMTRLEHTHLLHRLGYQLPVAIHPRATIASDVTIGAGTVVAAGAVINPGASVGQSVIINTLAGVDHDCRIGDAAHVCPGVRLAGNVTVGTAAWIGIGATVVQNVKIGDRVTIGAGAVVLHDIPAGAVAYGVPAKVHRIEQP